MRKVLDLGELHKQLRQTEEHEPHFDEELNPYLLDTVLPQLEGEEPIRLEQIDFDQFDEEDPFTILDYYYWRENLCKYDAPHQQADFRYFAVLCENQSVFIGGWIWTKIL